MNRWSLAWCICIATLFACPPHVSALDIARFGDKVVLSWQPASTNDFYLQSTTNLTVSSAWTYSPDPFTNGSSDLVVTNEATTPRAFYRLQPWQILFDGTNVNLLRSPQSTSFPSNSWTVTNGTLVSKVVANATNLMTVGTYTNFELRFSWKCDTNGNSGIYYRQTLTGGLGSPEYQLFDDANVTNTAYHYQFANYTNAVNLMGAVYGLIAPTNKTVLPAGQWNNCRVLVQNQVATHWLNGTNLLTYQINNPAYTNMINQATDTYIAIQNKANGDDGVVPGKVYFREIKIRSLP